MINVFVSAHSPVRGLPSWGLAALILVLVGCESGKTDFAKLERPHNTASEEDQLARAMELVEHIEQFDHEQASAQILTHLSQWINKQKVPNDWLADPLHTSLSSRYSDFSQANLLPAMHIIIQDYFTLREAVWMRDVGNWQIAALNQHREQLARAVDAQRDEVQKLAAAEMESNGEQLVASKAKLAQLEAQLRPAWLASAQKTHGVDAAEDLAQAAWLFDWTVRNIQLEATNWNFTYLDEEREDALAKQAPNKAFDFAPGSKYYAWQALLVGRADAVTRANIFLQLCRQQKIQVVMLALRGEQENEFPQPWVAAVVIGNALYLFDPELGLPLPGADGTGIVTWAQLKAEPQLLDQLSPPGGPKYRVTAADLSRIVGLIDAPPAYLSQRMSLVERKLRGEQKLVLTVQPTPLARQLRKLGVEQWQLWNLPYETIRYSFRRERHAATLTELNKELAVFGGSLPLFAGRLQHLRGKLENNGPEAGAKGLYLLCRRTDKEIGQIDSSAELERWLKTNSQALRNDAKAREEFLAHVKQQAIVAKQDATYWLGLVSYELDEFGVAIDFLKLRTLDADPNGPWTAGAQYNLARSYEAAGNYLEAAKILEASQSPQRAGNLLRAQQLRKS